MALSSLTDFEIYQLSSDPSRSKCAMFADFCRSVIARWRPFPSEAYDVDTAVRHARTARPAEVDGGQADAGLDCCGR